MSNDMRRKLLLLTTVAEEGGQAAGALLDSTLTELFDSTGDELLSTTDPA